jgi:hypothetical protein
MSVKEWFELLGVFSYVIIFIVVILLIHIGLLIFTRFTRTITVETNMAYGFGSGRYGGVNNMISTNEGTVYRVNNVPLLLHFRAAEVQSKLKPKTTHRVKGYGLRIPIFGMYPTITGVIE